MPFKGYSLKETYNLCKLSWIKVEPAQNKDQQRTKGWQKKWWQGLVAAAAGHVLFHIENDENFFKDVKKKTMSGWK